jgi:hypothetical protein
LFPPKPGREREWESARLAASAAQGEDELTDAEWTALFGPEAGR